MRRHKGGKLVLVLTAALALGACGSDEPRLTKAEFVEQGTAICTEISDRIDSAAQSAFSEPGMIPTAEEISDFAAETVAPSIEEEVERLSELRPPEDDVERVEEILEAGRNGVDTVRQDPTIIVNTNDNGFGRYQELSSAYGLQNCGAAGDVTSDALAGITRDG